MSSLCFIQSVCGINKQRLQPPPYTFFPRQNLEGGGGGCLLLLFFKILYLYQERYKQFLSPISP